MDNEIKKVDLISNINNIQFLRFDGNLLKNFPESQLSSLKRLNLSRNPIKDFTSVYTSEFPMIEELLLDYGENDDKLSIRPENDEVTF